MVQFPTNSHGKNLCAPILLARSYFYGFSLPRPSHQRNSFPKTPTVQSSPEINPRHPGTLGFILTKIGSTWRSLANSSASPFGRLAPQGDPTWPYAILGARTAWALGVWFKSVHTLRVPKDQELNYRIERINEKLRSLGYDPIYLRFSSLVPSHPLADGQKAGYAESAVRHFVTRLEYPYTESEIVHDVSHHFLNILATEKLLAPTMAQLNVAIAFVDFLRNMPMKHWTPLGGEILRENYINLIFQIALRNLDILLGNIPHQIIETSQLKEFLSNRDLYRLMTIHLGKMMGTDGRQLAIPPFERYTLADSLREAVLTTPLRFLREIIILREINNHVALSRVDLSPFAETRRNQELFSQLDGLLAEFTRLLESQFYQFLADKKDISKTVISIFDPDFNVIEGLADREHAIAVLRRRVHEIQSAAKKLSIDAP